MSMAELSSHFVNCVWEMKVPEEPLLGLATTEELFRELIARFTVHYPRDAVSSFNMIDRALSLSEMLGGLSTVDKEYRTVDG